MSRREHWDAVYRARSPDAVSWYRPRLERSLEWIERCAADRDSRIVDVGGGASTLVDDLLEREYSHVCVVDISSEALSRSRARLGAAAASVEWVVGDVTSPILDDSSVDVWHDRAVFHFLTDPILRDAYVAALHRAVRPGGFVVIATFGPNGPGRCSGLPVQRYASSEIADALGAGFELVDRADEQHVTPTGATQAFAYSLCRRRTEGEPPAP